MQGAVPVEALDWIKRWDLPPTTPDEREDHYLRLLETAAIGVKLREGRFEVKRRDIDLGLAPLGSRVTGRLALWRKWSFKVADGGGIKAPDSDWVTVGKKRYLCKYSKSISGLIPVDPKSFPERGCTLELTPLQVKEAAWWTVGFEAFGPDEGELRDTLTLVAETCFNRGNYPTLDAGNSFDYPEWLASMSE
jgi:hypothetical protein